MKRTKDDEMLYRRPDWMYDAEFHEWLEWSEKPTTNESESE